MSGDEGRVTLKVGDFATFAKGVANGHHLVNESREDVVYLEVGTRSDADACSYPDVDLMLRRAMSVTRTRTDAPIERHSQEA